MARSVNEIQQAIIQDVAATPELNILTQNTSKRAIWRLWTRVVATAISLLEQLIDLFQVQLEKTVDLTAPHTAQWLQAKVFDFQYDATNPQVVQLIDLIPKYQVVNKDLCIVTRCSVKSDITNNVIIKVAKSDPPAALSNDELNALQSYVNIVGVTGILYDVQSSESDKLYVEADIYYNGMYSAVIFDYVSNAIQNYLASIPFDGVVKISDLEIAIKNTTGVSDCVFKNIKARRHIDPLTSATFLVQNNQVISRLWNTISGYMIPETTAGNTLLQTLNFIPE